MTVTLTWQTIVAASTCVAAAVGLIAYFAKIVRWFDNQKKQTTDIESLENQHSKDIKTLEKQHNDDIKEIKEEQFIIVQGLLACLKGLQEKGCNGPVTEAVGTLEAYVNKKAHQ